MAQANGTIAPDRNQFGFFKLTEGKQTQTRRRKRQESEEAVKFEAGNPKDSQEGQETLETQDSEWAIREGNAPPPTWAKKTADDDAEPETSERKRQKTNNAIFRTFVLAPANEAPSIPPNFSTGTEFAADFGQHSAVDPVEQEILSIARDQRFLPEEVRSYYHRNGDLLATRQRFERVRAYIDNFP